MSSTNTPEYQEFLKRLKAARKRLKVTQKSLATSLGVHQPYVSKYENGERRLDVVEFLNVAQAIGIRPMHILEGLLANTGAKPLRKVLRTRLLTARTRR